MKKEVNILIIGAGAIGGITASLLTMHGYNVTLVARYPDLAEEISSKGQEISGYCGKHRVPVLAVAQVEQVKEKQDFILLATKAPDMPEVAQKVIPLMHRETLVITMQNGIVEEELASIVGYERTVGCVVGWGATMHDRTHLQMTSRGEITIGYLINPVDTRLLELKKIMESIVPVQTSNRILSHLYSKLIINSCITTIGAISGLRLGHMLIRHLFRQVFIAVIREAVLVANYMKLRIEPYAGKLDYYEFLRWNRIRKHLFLLAFGSKYWRLKSSSLQSLERGKKSEVKYFNGYISEKGKEVRAKTPMNDLLTRMMMEIEAGKRSISKENFTREAFKGIL